MGKIALLLSLGFTAYLYYREFRTSKSSRALWIPTIWLLIIGSRKPNQWLSLGSVTHDASQAHIEGSPVNRLFFFGMIIIGVVILSRRHLDWNRIASDNKWMLLFFAFTLISILWSDFPSVSAKRWFKTVIGSVVMALIVLTEKDPADAIRSIVRRCAYLLIPLSVIFIKYFPLYGRHIHPFSDQTINQGATLGKNQLGGLCLICGLVLVSTCIQRGAWKHKKALAIDGALLLMVVWLLKKADSATSLLCLIGGSTVLYLARRPSFRGLFMVVARNFGVVVVLSIPFVIISAELALSTVGTVTGHADTLFGRVKLWGVLIDMSDAPILGQGFEGFWVSERLETLWAIYWWQPTSAHNGYVETYLAGGLIRVLLLIFAIVAAVRRVSLKAADAEMQILLFAYLIVGILYNITESAYDGLHIVMFSFLLAGITTPGQFGIIPKAKFLKRPRPVYGDRLVRV